MIKGTSKLHIVGRLIAGVIAVASVIFSLTAAQSTALPPAMVSYWKFDTGKGITAFDSFGLNHGTIFGATWTTGIAGSAIHLDGNNDYVFMGNDSAWDFGSSDFSICFWLKPNGDSALQGGHDSVLVIGTGADDIELWISYGGNFPSQSGNRLWLNTNYTAAGWVGFNADSGIEMGKDWHFVTVTKSGDNWKMYINGEIRVERAHAFNPAPGTLKLGQYVIPGRHLNGFIDEVAIYKRALGPEEIRHHYINGLNGLGYTGVI